ncbi:MAG: hypothetical protein M3492_02535, partial [Actinomycetota bacterium]|nr:hypothetical protein [Actinomycetota bacterium]
PYETVAGYVLSELGHLPDVGDQVRAGEHLLTVMAMDGRRIARLHVSLAPQPSEDTDTAPDPSPGGSDIVTDSRPGLGDVPVPEIDPRNRESERKNSASA